MLLQAANLGIKDAETEVRKVLKLVRMEGAAGNKYKNCSLGMKQRIGIAMALLGSPKLLILDEPITGLDPAAAQDLYKTLSYLNRKEGMAIVMVTHDLKAAMQSARNVLYIGRTGYFHGTVAEYLASPQGRRFREGE